MNTSYPKCGDGWYATSYLALQLGDAKQALKSIDNALLMNPDTLLWNVHKASILNVLGEEDKTQNIVNSLMTKKFSDINSCVGFAMLLTRMRDYPNAEKTYKKAIKLSPNEPQLYFNLASIQRYLGKIEESESNLDKTINFTPDDSEAILLRSSLRKQTNEKNHIKDIQKVIDSGVTKPLKKAQLYYSMAKELEDLEQFEQSFKMLEIGANSKRKNIKYDLNTDLNIMTKIIEVYDSNLFENNNSGYDNDEAIFILGLPRTGSTLIERIISNHDDVHSAGELNDFAIEMMKQCKAIEHEAPDSRTAMVELTTKIDFKMLGKNYINAVRTKEKNKKNIIDKLPLNSLNIGLIHLALPKAKIIHVERNPMDTCYSIYKHLFNSGYPFSYCLSELANYYIAHNKLMKHWKTILPGVVYSVKYEELVSNLEIESKKLIEYCGLEWQAKCTQFHLNKKAALTASATQVRSSIYTSSVNKWSYYENELKELKERLTNADVLL